MEVERDEEEEEPCWRFTWFLANTRSRAWGCVMSRINHSETARIDFYWDT